MAEIEEVLEFVVGRGAACRLPGHWAVAKVPADFFGAPEPSVLLAALRDNFTVEDICKSGVASAGDGDNLNLHPGLTDPGAMIMVLRAAAGKRPFDLLTDRGLIAARRLPVSAALEDYRYTSLHPDRKSQLFVAFSVAEIAVLALCRMPAALATGLERLGRGALDRFCKSFGLDGGLGKRPDRSTNPPRLVFVGWSPAQMSLAEPANLKNVVAHFQGLDQHMGIDLGDLGVWKPNQEHLDGFLFSLKHGNPRYVKEAMLSSVEGLTIFIVERLKQSRDQIGEYASALEKWNNAVWPSSGRTQRAEAWDQLQRAYERDLILPVLEQVKSTENPLERNLLVAVAGVSRMLHPQSLILASNFATAMRNSGAKAVPLFPKEEFQQLMAMTDRLKTLIQELQPWRPKRGSIVIRKATPRNPSSSNWDSPPKRSPR